MSMPSGGFSSTLAAPACSSFAPACKERAPKNKNVMNSVRISMLLPSRPVRHIAQPAESFVKPDLRVIHQMLSRADLDASGVVGAIAALHGRLDGGDVAGEGALAAIGVAEHKRVPQRRLIAKVHLVTH